MPQNETMTLDEKLAISRKAAELKEAGDEEGALRLMKTAPMPPKLAMVMKEKMGAAFLKNGGYNLSEADKEFGPDWLNE